MARVNAFAAGASAARNKIAKSLRSAGHSVPPRPTDEDILAVVSKPSQVGPRALVLFLWNEIRFQFVVPMSVIKSLGKAPENSHQLFSATFDGRNSQRHSFNLAVDHEGEVIVQHRRLWRDAVDTVPPESGPSTNRSNQRSSVTRPVPWALVDRAGLAVHVVHQQILPERIRRREIRLAAAELGDLLDELD